MDHIAVSDIYPWPNKVLKKTLISGQKQRRNGIKPKRYGVKEVAGVTVLFVNSS